MRVLLDTHTFLWWTSNDDQLSGAARSIISVPANELWLSTASAWEIAIKWRRGRLALPDPPGRYVPERAARHRIKVLPVEMRHALHVAELVDHHADPFDRLLVAQSELESLPILSSDSKLDAYDVDRIW